MTTKSKTTVVVYVRLCDGDRDCRELTFEIPEGISQRDLLDMGFAIDGNEASKSVVAYRDGDMNVPLSNALRQAQLHLVNWLEEYDYEVVFD